jgi:hypothetical protein
VGEKGRNDDEAEQEGAGDISFQYEKKDLVFIQQQKI